MTLSFPLSFPAVPVPRRMTFSRDSRVIPSECPFSGVSQTIVWPFKRWRVDITYPPLAKNRGFDNLEISDPWIAFLLALDEGNTFLCGDIAKTTPRGAGTGAPVVDGAGQTGQTLDVKGCTAYVSGWLKKGDWFQLGYRHYRLIDDADTDASGTTTLSFFPSLRESPADEEALILENTKGLYRLLTPSGVLWDLIGSSGNPIHGISISAVEAL